jgi:hypothetical protein
MAKTPTDIAFTESLLERFATMTREDLKKQVLIVEENIAKCGSVGGREHQKRMRDVIDAMGELKFPGRWNPWDGDLTCAS